MAAPPFNPQNYGRRFDNSDRISRLSFFLISSIANCVPAAPLYWTDKFRSGAWLVTRYADVLAGLHDSRLSSKRSHTLTAALSTEVQSEFATFNKSFPGSCCFSIRRSTGGLRKLLNKEFTPNMIHRLRPRIQEIVDALLDDATGKSEIEYMTNIRLENAGRGSRVARI